jgi:nucleoside-diphosphate-sugar epimerase
METLVVGGTGPTGPFIVNGLRERGHHVTIFHRGTHEVPEIPDDVAHIHGDPHFLETIEEALAGHTFDQVIATYGRIRLIAEALRGKTGRFISIGGIALYRGFANPRLLKPVGVTNPVRESAPLVADESEDRFGYLIARTEADVFEHHPTATVFRYPYVYGPYQLVPREWCVVRRILDGRRRIIVPDGGMSLSTHGWAGNLAHAVLLAVDKPDAAAGKSYNCGDIDQLSIRQLVDVIAGALGASIEQVSLPGAVAGPAKTLTLGGRHHQLMDLAAIRADLGYDDVLPAVDAVAETARWYAENRPEPGGEIEQRLGDPFDYEAEDHLMEAADQAMELLRRAAAEPVVTRARDSAVHDGLGAEGRRRPHPYAHPKNANEVRDHRGR